MRLAAIVPDSGANPRYRALLPMAELARAGHEVTTFSLDGSWERMPALERLLDRDVVYFWRVFKRPARVLAQRLREAGVGVMWDNDDDLPATPKGTPHYRTNGGMSGQREWAEMKAMMRLADVITTPSELLAARYREVGDADVRVIENFLPAVGPSSKSQPDHGARVTIGWVAGAEHVVDIRGLRLRAVVREVLDARPNARIVTIGLPLDAQHARYERWKYVWFDDLPATIARLDVGIAPLVDNAFNRARSNVKLKEYGAQAVPWLASPVGAYCGLGASEGGRLVRNDEWCDALIEIIDDVEQRRMLAASAHAWATRETLSANVWRWEEALRIAANRRTPA